MELHMTDDQTLCPDGTSSVHHWAKLCCNLLISFWGEGKVNCLSGQHFWYVIHVFLKRGLSLTFKETLLYKKETRENGSTALFRHNPSISNTWNQSWLLSKHPTILWFDYLRIAKENVDSSLVSCALEWSSNQQVVQTVLIEVHCAQGGAKIRTVLKAEKRQNSLR